MKFKLLTLFLALTLLTTTAVACTTDPIENEDSSSEETESIEEVIPNVEKNNYNSEFYMTIQPQSNYVDYYWVENSEGDAMSEAVYNRQEKVKNYLGVDIIATTSLGHDQYGEPFKAAVKNKDGSVDSLLSHAYMYLSQFISGGFLTDFNDVSSIDLNADYWNLDVMTEVAAKDHLYLGFSDFRVAHTHVIAFNKEMMEEHSSAFEETPYEMVDNYHWTLDRMISMAALVSTDKTSNGKTEDDVFGITGRQWVPFIGFLPACDVDLVGMNEEGYYEVSVYNELNKEKTAAIVEKLLSLSKSENAWFRFREESTPDIPLTSGRTLMSTTSVNELTYFIEYDIDFGVLPYPIYDENQKDVGYRSLDWGGWICIPSYMRDETMIGETLEAISFFSSDVTVTFYEKLLGKQVAEAPDDRRMLDVIWDSLCSDIGLTYSHIDYTLDMNLYMLPTVTHANTTDQLSSYVAGYERAANRALRSFFSRLK